MEGVSYVPAYSIIPFALMLGAIAVLPLVATRFWESNRNKLIVSLVLGVPTAVWMLAQSFTLELERTMLYDYVPFIILLGALFVITGGIHVEGYIAPTPRNLSVILAIGAVLASFMGTTGAAMLLVRPIITAIRPRKYKAHTILFFIAVVANCGGLLTPLGDPPLFMMYLRGAPFEWFFKLLPEWAFANVFLILTFFATDSYLLNKEGAKISDFHKEKKEKIRLSGNLNFLWLFGVVLAVAFINENVLSFIRPHHPSSFLREGAILLMGLLSLRFTKQKTRAANKFSWEPIEEVAYLFFGIFITMAPALMYLELNAHRLGIDNATLFYFATGGLSSVLDNTPTAVTFHSAAMAFTEGWKGAIVAGIPETFLKAISVGAVFFGAMTYIGNGPNFMVKAIAESQQIKMPDFFAYVYKFSLIVLLPLFVVVELLFIR